MTAPLEALQAELDALPRPLLVLSTAVGRGMFSIGEALVERAAGRGPVEHRPIEDFLPSAGLREDVERYRAISSRFPVLLNLVYRFPPIYQRKLLRERHLRSTDLGELERFLKQGPLAAGGHRAVLAVSHRAAFWAGLAKERAGLDVTLVGLSGEFGSSLGWRYVPWSAIQRFLSPVPRAEIRFPIPATVGFREVALPARAEYVRLAATRGDRRAVLVVCGYWGQGRIDRVLAELRAARPELELHAVCGENEAMRAAIAAAGDARVHAHGVVPSLAPLLERCGSVISKPGIATILEVHAARRALFLMRGMPVAEDNNLRHALAHLGAQSYSMRRFLAWLETPGSQPDEPQAKTEPCPASAR
jgi:hypothetical protein